MRGIADRSGIPGNGTTLITSATKNSMNAFVPFHAPLDTAINDLVFAVGNWQLNGGGGGPDVQTVPHVWTHRIEVEYPVGGACYPVTWGGAPSVTVPLGSLGLVTYYCDKLNIPGGIPAGAAWRRRHYISTTFNPFSNYATSRRTVAGTDLVEFGTDLADKSHSGTISSPQDTYFVEPLGMYCCSFDPASKSIGCIGDSHFAQNSDSPSNADSGGRVGHVAKSIANTHGCIYASSGGTSAFGHASSPAEMALELVRGRITHAYMDLVCNDVFLTGATVAQVQQNVLNVAAPFMADGIPIYIETPYPRTTSSNGWIDLAGQSTIAGESVRLTIVSWLQNNYAALGFAGINDMAAYLADSGNSSMWRSDGFAWTGTSGSGTHKTPAAITQTVADGKVPAVLRT